MLHRFKRWRRGRKYEEAYLDIENDRVVEFEKKRRQEIGTKDASYYEEYITKIDEDKSYESELDKEVNKLPAEVHEDNRVVDKPKSKISFLQPLFWLSLLASALYYFIPLTHDLLNTELKTDIGDKKAIETVVRPDENDTGDSKQLKAEEKDANDTVQTVISDVEGILGKSKETIQNQVELSNDKLKLYADIHGRIIFHAQDLRDVVQQYIGKNAQHVQVSSLGGRIEIQLNQMQYQLNRHESDPIQDLLNRRIERLRDISQATVKFDRESAAIEINAFLSAENTESKTFVDMLIEQLEEEGRSYRIEDGLVYFN